MSVESGGVSRTMAGPNRVGRDLKLNKGRIIRECILGLEDCGEDLPLHLDGVQRSNRRLFIDGRNGQNRLTFVARSVGEARLTRTFA